MELSDNINLKTYEVVRQDYFCGQDEPQFTFNKGRAYINRYGIDMFPDMDYVQLLVDKKEKILVIKPRCDKTKDSVKWCIGSRRKPRHISCIPLCYMIFKMMNWDMNARYRITGYKLDYERTPILVFELDDAICYEKKSDENGTVSQLQYFPSGWNMNFGTTEAKHNDDGVINMYDEDGTFEIKLSRKDFSEAKDYGKQQI